MDILNKMTTIYQGRFTSQEFKQLIEDHLIYIKQRSSQVIPVDSNTVSKWAGDFYGLLVEIGIKPNHHYTTMRLNNLNSPNSDFSNIDSILVPNESAVELVLSSLS